MKKILTGLLCVVLLAALTVPAGAWTKSDFKSGMPCGITATEDGGLIVTDTYHHVIWKTDVPGTPLVAAGVMSAKDAAGIAAPLYHDGAEDKAYFGNPWGIAPYKNGYAVTDTAASAVRLWADGAVTTFSGFPKAIVRPTGITADNDGSLFVADTGSGTVWKITEDGKAKVFCEGLTEPMGISFSDGVLYVAECGKSRIVKVENGVVTAVAGDTETASGGVYSDGYRDGPALKARFSHPQGVIASDGVLYVADTDNRAVRKIADGIVTTVAAQKSGEDRLGAPTGLAVVGDTLYVTDPFAGLLLGFDIRPADYTDVTDGAWYAPYVAKATERGLMQGIGDGLFDPDGMLTRAMFATMLSRVYQTADGAAVIAGDAEFCDVAEDDWFSDAVRWAADRGIVLGTENGFAPNEGVTREQSVTMMYRFAGMPGVTALDAYYTDAGEISPYAEDAMAWAVGTGLIGGFDDGTLRPGEKLTRAQAAKILTGFLEQSEK